ncbi:hypothetical protein BT69DRAFT_1308033 [Atractiella rhizophila]|nr:hypothetical protein BT69DRAFT_1308033 [Atractiella rhizophila]
MDPVAYTFPIHSPHIQEQDRPLLPSLIRDTIEFSRGYMGQYDASHDFQHLIRVVSLTFDLAASSPFPRSSAGQSDWDRNVLMISALLHDVGDKKYSDGTGANSVHEYLRSKGCSETFSQAIHELISSVSYTFETSNSPSVTSERLLKYPELACVQDADRLDAIGAIGIGRTFTFGGAKKRSGAGMSGTLDHFDEKLILLGGMMKTPAGKQLGEERTKRLKEFLGWWKQELETNASKESSVVQEWMK